MELIQQEQQTYEEMWGLPAYAAHSPGATLVPTFFQMVDYHDGRSQWRAASVLDAGCGSGQGGLALAEAGFRVTMCDLTGSGRVPESMRLPFHEVALWDDVLRVVDFHDYVYCCDVMEHIPPTFAMLVAHQLLRVARKGAFFSISLVPDHFGAWVGKPLHQTVQSFTDWRKQLNTVGRVVEARDLLTSGLYFVKR